MASVMGKTALPFLGCVALLAALIFHILSFASPYWAVVDNVGNIGLWRKATCRIESSTECYRYNMHWNVDAWLNAVRALECLTLIFWCVPMMIIPVYIYVALGLKYRCFMGVLALFVLFGVVCNIIGAIIYGVKIGIIKEWSLGWCLIISFIGGVFGIVSVAMLVLAIFNRPEFDVERHYPSGFYVDPYKNKLYVVENIERYDTLSVKSNPSVIVPD